MTRTQKITYPIIAVLVGVMISRLVNYWNQKPVEKPTATIEESTPVVEEKVIPATAAERTYAKVVERNDDEEYMADLVKMQKRQRELADARAAARKDFEAWHDGWLASNETARAISEKIEAIVMQVADDDIETNQQFRALVAELNTLIKSSPEGKTYAARLHKAEKDIEKHQLDIRAYMSARMRRQEEEHKGEEAAAVEKKKATGEFVPKAKDNPMLTEPPISKPAPAKDEDSAAGEAEQKQPLNK